VSASSDRRIHYVIAIPPDGIPHKVMRLIDSIHEKYGHVYTTVYQARTAFSMKPKRGKYVLTTHWMEISERPLSKRPSPEWPLHR
jgi:hypothetical protein